MKIGVSLYSFHAYAGEDSLGMKGCIAKAKEMTEILKKKEKCDVIICISHLGWKIDGIDDSEVAPATRDIDLILGGHSHTYFKQLEYLNNLDGKPVPIDQNGKSAIWVGKMTLDIVKNK